MSQAVIIEPIVPVREDERGYAAEYLHDRSGRQLLIFTRQGVVRGRHYHTGKSATKSPEILILLTGSITLRWRRLQDESLSEANIQAPARISIAAGVWHELLALTDCLLSEMNSMEEHAADTVYTD